MPSFSLMDPGKDLRFVYSIDCKFLFEVCDEVKFFSLYLLKF